MSEAPTMPSTVSVSVTEQPTSKANLSARLSSGSPPLPWDPVRSGTAQRKAQACSRLARQDREALSTPAEAYLSLRYIVWRVLRRLGVSERAAEDATQDVFLTAHRRWNDYEYQSSRKAWIMGITTKTASNYRRKQCRAADDPALGADMREAASSAPGSDPLSAAEQLEARQLLESLLESLGETQRALVVLVYFEEWPVTEAATALRLSQRGAFTRLESAKRSLGKTLKRLRARDDWRRP